MAKTQAKRMVGQGKAVAAKVKAKAGRAGRKVQVTLGDLIAAAFDVAGGETKRVAKLVSSRPMAQLTGRQIVFEG